MFIVSVFYLQMAPKFMQLSIKSQALVSWQIKPETCALVCEKVGVVIRVVTLLKIGLVVFSV